MSGLLQVQREFQDYLLRGERAVGGRVVGTARVPAMTRLGIYAGAYRSRLAEALASNYPALAKLLGDKSTTPYLYGEANHVLLEVPVMDNIGQLRQTGALEVGQQYWMVFSNKGNLVKAGDRVNVLIGSFHIDGLVVQ